MKKNKKLLNFNHEKEENEEKAVLGISSDEYDDDELEPDYDDGLLSDDDEFGNVHQIRAKKLEMDSDLDEDDDDGKFWKKKLCKLRLNDDSAVRNEFLMRLFVSIFFTNEQGCRT